MEYATQKDTYKALWKLGAPTLVEAALGTAVTYVDTAMVGAIGAAASAAVGLTAMVVWLQFDLFFAFGVGALSCIARYDGAGEKQKAHETSVQSLWFLLALGILETVVLCSLAFRIPVWLNGSAEILHDAGMYLLIVSIPTIFKGTTVILGNVLRANKDTATPMRINIGVNVMNIVLNQLLIGAGTTIAIGSLSLHIPGAGWGVTGAAIATSVSQVFGGIVIFLVFLKNPLTTPRGYSLRPNPVILRKCARTAFPLVGERIVMGTGLIAFTGLIAQLGTISMAAHTIAITIEEAFYIPGYGIQTALSTLCGNAAGRRDKKELRMVVRAGMVSAVGIMTVMSSFLFFQSYFCMSVFTPDVQVMEAGAKVLRMIALSEPFFAALIILEGVFHGIGETRIPFLFGAFTMWGIRILGTWICLHLFGGSLVSVWICMIADNMTRFLLLFWLYKFGKWKDRLGI